MTSSVSNTFTYVPPNTVAVTNNNAVHDQNGVDHLALIRLKQRLHRSCGPQTCWALWSSCLISSFTVFLVVLSTAPPTQPVASTVVTILGILGAWLGLTLLAKSIYLLRSLECLTRSPWRYLVHLFCLGGFLLYFYLALYAPTSSCFTAQSIVSSMRKVPCPKLSVSTSTGETVTEDAMASSDGGCVRADIDVQIKGLCTLQVGSQPICVRRTSVVQNDSSSWSNTTSNSDCMETMAWLDTTITDGHILHVQWVDNVTYEQSQSIHFLNDNLLCGYVTKPICVFPVRLPPFIRKDTDTGDVMFQSSTAHDMLQFLSSLLMYAWTLVLWLIVQLYRCGLHTARHKRCVQK